MTNTEEELQAELRAELEKSRTHKKKVDDYFQDFIRKLVVARFGCKTQKAFEKALKEICFERVERDGKDWVAVLKKPEDPHGKYELLGRKPLAEILGAGEFIPQKHAEQLARITPVDRP